MSSTIIAPERSMEQRLAALRTANAVRSDRAVLKVDLKAGRRSVLELLAAPPSFVDTMKVFNLLLATPKWGRVKVNRMLTHARISPSKTVGGLSERQREELVLLIARGL